MVLLSNKKSITGVDNQLKPFHTTQAVAMAFAVCAVVAGLFYWRAGPTSSMHPFTLAFNSPETYTEPLLIKLTDLAISILPLGAQPAHAETQDNVVKYVDAYPNTDVVQTKHPYKIKEDIILKQPGHPDVFEYQIDMTQFDVSKDDQGNLYFFQKEHKDDNDYKRFTIPAPFMIDANGKKSSTQEVDFALTESGRLVLKPSAAWLAKAKYPVILDPTVEITILNVHSHPQQGQNWTIDFTTQGTADLKIIPNDQSTIDDDQFTSLSCGGQIVQPQILADNVIYYPNWSCSGTGEVIFYTKTAGNHTMQFNFGGQIAYAYNSASSVVIFRKSAIFRKSVVFRGAPEPSFIGSTYVNTAGYTVAGTPVPITLPTGTQAGDLVLIVNYFSGLISTASTINKTGWTSNLYLGDTVNNYYHTIFTKKVTSDDLSGITITPSAASTGNTYGGFEAVTFRNAASFNVQLNATGNTTDTSISIPGITKNAISAFVLTLTSDRTGSASWTPTGANWTELTEGKDQTAGVFDNTGSYVSSANYTSGAAITWTRTASGQTYSSFTVDVIR